jgi:hypothetical protein
MLTSFSKQEYKCGYKVVICFSYVGFEVLTSGGCEESFLLGYNTMYFYSIEITFQRNKPNKNSA